MRCIALIAMSAKPYHAGHDCLIRLAATECDSVFLYVSTSDRARTGEVPVLGRDMELLWREVIAPTLPTRKVLQSKFPRRSFQLKAPGMPSPEAETASRSSNAPTS